MTSMEGIPNFRELGGLPAADGRQVRSGMMYRSGHLADTTQADRQALLGLGIKTVVDLRTPHDISVEGSDSLPDGINHVHVPIHDDAGNGEEIRTLVSSGDMELVRAAFGDGRALEMGRKGSAAMAYRGPRMDSFRPAIEVVTDPASWPVLWHCSAGKDRAGWTATAVLLAVGATQGTIVDHYMESNGRGMSGRSDWATPELRELLDPFVFVQEEYVEAQIEAVDNDWGGIEAMFVDGYGLDGGHVDTLRSELLEPR
jgi:protein-tyrosine phosphatase